MVYLTGLPEFSEKAGSRTGATFARRFATNVLDPLSDSDIRLALDEFITPGWEAAIPEATAHVERILSLLPKKEANIVYAIYRGTQYGFKHRALEAYLLNEWPAIE